MLMSRVIHLRTVSNLRTLAGLKSADGKSVKNDILFRSAALGKASDKDLVILRDKLKIKKTIDLRTNAEKDKAPDRTVEGIEYIYLPISRKTLPGISREITPEDKYSISSDMIPDMTEMYERIIKDSECQVNFGIVLKTIMSQRDGAILWHCTAGKDRCGMVTLFILSMLEISKEDIMRDYMLTNFSSFDAVKYFILILLLKRDLKLAKKIYKAYIVKRSYLQSAIDTMDRDFGGIKNYIINQLGISNDAIEEFKSYCLE